MKGGALQVRAMCEGARSLMELLSHAESDCWLALGLAFTLSVVPLTLQLSNLSGFLWARTLQVCKPMVFPTSRWCFPLRSRQNRFLRYSDIICIATAHIQVPFCVDFAAAVVCDRQRTLVSFELQHHRSRSGSMLHRRGCSCLRQHPRAVSAPAAQAPTIRYKSKLTQSFPCSSVCQTATACLQGNRAQRIEMLLLHEFHRRKFMLPDKPDKRSSGGAPAATTGSSKATKGRASKGSGKGATPVATGHSAGNADEEEGEGEGNDEKEGAAGNGTGAQAAAQGGKAKGPQYAGAGFFLLLLFVSCFGEKC